jgi:hypothetical protein
VYATSNVSSNPEFPPDWTTHRALFAARSPWCKLQLGDLGFSHVLLNSSSGPRVINKSQLVPILKWSAHKLGYLEILGEITGKMPTSLCSKKNRHVLRTFKLSFPESPVELWRHEIFAHSLNSYHHPYLS